MGNNSPGKLRKAGRLAFCLGGDPMDFQPFLPGSFSYKYHLPHWLEGWKEEEKRTLKEMEEEAKGINSTLCPCCGRPLEGGDA